MKKQLHLTEQELHSLVRNLVLETIENLDPRYVQNELGMYDDDELNASVDAMNTEDLEGEVARIIRTMAGDKTPDKTTINFKDLAGQLQDKFGFTFVGPNQQNESYDFENDQYTLEIYPMHGMVMPRPGQISVMNLHVYHK